MTMKTRQTAFEPLPASDLFALLREAKTAGYTVKCVPAGPRDMPHSGVFIYGPGGLHEYLVSRDCSWGLKEARAAALVWINNHKANNKLADKRG